MALSVICSSCGARLRASEKSAGRTFKCSNCGKPVNVGAVAVPPRSSLQANSSSPPPPHVEFIVVDTGQVKQTRSVSTRVLVVSALVGTFLFALVLTVGLVVFVSFKSSKPSPSIENSSGKSEPQPEGGERTPLPPQGGLNQQPTQKAPGGAPATDPSSPREARPDPAREPSWTLAGQAARLGDLQVRIVETTIGKVRVKDILSDTVSENDHLTVKVELLNINPTKKVDYHSWAGSALSLDRDRALLKDNFGNLYKRINFGLGAHPAGGIEGVESLYPNKSVTDVLVFEMPLDRATYLDLELPASNYGSKGLLRFRIPKFFYDEKARAQYEEAVRRQKEEEQRREEERRRAAEQEAQRKEEARLAEAKGKEEARITASIAKNRAALQAADPRTRIQAAVDLGKLGPPAAAAVPELSEALKDKDRGVGKAAADALVQIGKPAVPVLIETLANGKDRSRGNAAYALARIDPKAKEAVPAPDATVRKLRALFRDTDEVALLVAVMDALAIVGGLERSMVDSLLADKGLRHADPAIRSKALDSLRRVALDTLPIKTLADLNLDDASPEVREQAGKVFAERMEHLSDSDMKDVRALLAMSNKPKAVQLGLDAVKHGGTKSNQALPELLKLLAAAKEKDKLAMALLLTDIDAKDRQVAATVGPILVAALRPETQDVAPNKAVLQAIVALGEPVVGEIFKALEAADDRGAINAVNRKALFIALQQLGPKAYSEDNVRIVRRYWSKERYKDVQEEAGKAIRGMLRR